MEELAKLDVSVVPETSLSKFDEDFKDMEDSLYVCDIGEVLQKHKRWLKVLPRVHPHYAVKCNPDDIVLKLMVALGMGFDCASQVEIRQLLSLGASPDDIIYANPCKQISHLVYAAEQNVKRTVFDSKEELDKIKQYYPDAELLLRIKTDDSTAKCRLSQKYGADIEDCTSLIDYAKNLDLKVIGICFHVGSGCTDASTYAESLRNARDLFDYGARVGYRFTVLDIGGGYPGNEKTEITFEQIGAVVNGSLEELFPLSTHGHVSVIAEPGRYYVTSAYTLVTNVIAKRVVTCNKRSATSVNDGETVRRVYNYHINEGIFGAMNFLFYDHGVNYPVFPPHTDGKKLHLSTIWGPALTNVDKIMYGVEIPELEVGDAILWKDMGAYTMSSEPDDFKLETPINYVIAQKDVGEILKLVPSSPQLSQ